MKELDRLLSKTALPSNRSGVQAIGSPSRMTASFASFCSTHFIKSFLLPFSK
ncbi:hypothetical protein PO124_15195 [Bacillus licheniformis]|nr:hypothetical protein [Bacillus licheniformis]